MENNNGAFGHLMDYKSVVENFGGVTYPTEMHLENISITLSNIDLSLRRIADQLEANADGAP